MLRSQARIPLLGGAILVLTAVYLAPRFTGGGAPTAALAAPNDTPPAVADAPGAVAALAGAEAALRAGRAGLEMAWPANPFVTTPEDGPDSRSSAADAAQSPTTPPGPLVFVLKAVITGDPPRAVLNERVVAVGDVLSDGSMVLAITADSLTLQGPRGTLIVPLGQ